MSIKYKIAFLFSSLVTLLFTLISITIYFFSVTERDNLFKNRLKNRALSTAKIYASLKDNDYSLLRRMDGAAVASLYNKSITITKLDNSQDYLYADKKGDSLYLSRKVIEQTKINSEYFFNQLGKKAVAIHYFENGESFVIAVAAQDYDGNEYLAQLKKILLISLGLSVLLSFAAGILFAKSLIRPISQITQEVNLITSRSLSKRIKINAAGDELTKLALTFNNLLDRLQDSFSSQRRFISNASHELSTPLTSVSSQLEVALQKQRSPDDYCLVLQSVLEDVRGLQQLTRSLLDIAKTGSEGGIELSEVRLDEILFKAIADVQKQNEGFRISLGVLELPDDERMLTVFGNSNLLYIAFKNIIENGCKYSEDRQASVTASFGNSIVTVNIFNSGDVITQADIENIFQPFFRADSALQKPGFGLGLTLSKQIIALHKGGISVESIIGKGTFFTIQLPNILSLQ